MGSCGEWRVGEDHKPVSSSGLFMPSYFFVDSSLGRAHVVKQSKVFAVIFEVSPCQCENALGRLSHSSFERMSASREEGAKAVQ